MQSSYVDLVRISAAFATPERFDAGSAAAEPALIDGGILSFIAEPVAQSNMGDKPQHLIKLKNSFIECNKFRYRPANYPK